jgi:hypothetical protein
MRAFSSRLCWDARPNPLARALDERLRRGAPIVDLTESNPTRVRLPYPAEAIRAALSSAGALDYAPAPRGLPEARRAVADWLARRGDAADPEELVLTSGTSEAYGYLFKLLLDPGETVLAPRPSYPLLDHLARAESVRLRRYALVRDPHWRIDFDSLRRMAAGGARAVVVVHPNNPTGSFLKRSEIDPLVKICGEFGLSLISDEVFLEYAHAEDPHRFPTLAAIEGVPVFCLDGLSKSAGLPQAKLAWIRAAGPAAPRRQALERLELIADAYLSVSGPIQVAAAGLIEAGGTVRTAIRARLRENLQALRATLAASPACEILEPEGGWTSSLRLPATRTDEQWALDLLERQGVLVQPGYFYDFEEEAILVLSLLTEPAVFRTGIERLASLAGTA